MNSEQINLVRRSFEKISSEAFAEIFYKHLFSIQPALRLLFPDDFGERREKLLPMIEASIEMLDEPKKLVPVLEEFGRRHALDGIREEHYETLGTALLASLWKTVGAEDFTGETEAAWTELYQIMSETMKRGARGLSGLSEQNQKTNTEENSMKIFKQAKLITGFIFLTFIFAVSSYAQTTAFTYQGKLNDGAMAANGTYDFLFKVYDTMAVGTGNQIGSVQNRVTATVTNGIFTVQLDFGSLPFSTGADRYLEIGVRQNQGQNYTTLAPRQPVTSSPFAIRSLSSEMATTAMTATTAETATTAINSTNSAQLGGIAANQYVLTTDSRLTDSRNPLSGSVNYIQNTTDQQSSSNFNISGTGSANTLNASQFTIGGTRVLGIGIGSVYVGTYAGQNTFGFAFSNSFVGNSAGMNNTEGEANSFFGANAGISNTTGSLNTVIGSFADVGVNNLQYATAIGAGSVVSTNDTIVLGRANGADRVRIPGLGSGGSTTLCRNPSNQISVCSSSLRYKTNINPFSSGLSIINRLKPITFDWKDGGMKDLGLGAEDVAAVDENLIIRNEKGEVEGVKYDRLGVVLINAVKEQQTQLETQQKLIEAQARQIELLKQLVCSQNPNAGICKEEK
jgi:hemoglobin-like flavoprotein